MANRDNINKDYPKFEKYNKNFEVDDAMIGEFKKIAESKGVTWNDEQFERSEKWIKLRIKGMIAQDVWNIDKFYQVVAGDDKMIQKAAEVLNSKKEYEKILRK